MTGAEPLNPKSLQTNRALLSESAREMKRLVLLNHIDTMVVVSLSMSLSVTTHRFPITAGLEAKGKFEIILLHFHYTLNPLQI